jgi:hypothetical protein
MSNLIPSLDGRHGLEEGNKILTRVVYQVGIFGWYWLVFYWYFTN